MSSYHRSTPGNVKDGIGTTSPAVQAGSPQFRTWNRPALGVYQAGLTSNDERLAPFNEVRHRADQSLGAVCQDGVSSVVHERDVAVGYSFPVDTRASGATIMSFWPNTAKVAHDTSARRLSSSASWTPPPVSALILTASSEAKWVRPLAFSECATSCSRGADKGLPVGSRATGEINMSVSTSSGACKACKGQQMRRRNRRLDRIFQQPVRRGQRPQGWRSPGPTSGGNLRPNPRIRRVPDSQRGNAGTTLPARQRPSLCRGPG